MSMCKKRIFGFTALITGIALIFGFTSCSEDGSPGASSQSKFSITVDVTSGALTGSVTAEPNSNIAAKTPVTVTINPADGYELESISAKKSDGDTIVTIDGAGIVAGSKYSFPMPAFDITVFVSFWAVSPPGTYSVNIAGGITNGTITAEPNRGVSEGTEVTVTIAPNDDYRLKGNITVRETGSDTDVSVEGRGNTRTFSMPASDVTVSGEFEPISAPTYFVTVASGITNGSIIANPASNISAGTKVTLTINPASGYRLKNLFLTPSVALTVVDATTQTFTMPAFNVIVYGEFVLIPTAAVPLTKNIWESGEIYEPYGFNLYEMTVVENTTYYLQTSLIIDYDKMMAIQIKLSARYEDDTVVSLSDSYESFMYPSSFTASQSGKVFIQANALGEYTGEYRIMYSTDCFGPSFDHLVSLDLNKWADGEITEPYGIDWYSISVDSGQSYYIWWNGALFGDGEKTLDVDIAVFYSDGTFIDYSDWDGWEEEPIYFTASSNDTVYIRIRCIWGIFEDTGTYGVAYTTDYTRPTAGSRESAKSSLNKAVGAGSIINRTFIKR